MVEDREVNSSHGQKEEIPRVSVLVLDCDYICHTVLYSVPALSHLGLRTEIIMGFMKRLMTFSQQFKPKEIVFAWDSKPSLRQEVYPEYKMNRRGKKLTEKEKKNKKAAKGQFKELREKILPSLGFKNIFIQDGYEADDIIASVVKNNPKNHFIIVSSDKDLYQLLSNNCYMYNPSAKKMRTPDSFQEEWGCRPGMWGSIKSISGCATDNVTGAQYENSKGVMVRVGEKTVIKFTKGELSDTTLAHKAITEVIKSRLAEDISYLVVLPMVGTDEYKISRSSISRESFGLFCREYGMKSMMNGVTLEKWGDLIDVNK